MECLFYCLARVPSGFERVSVIVGPDATRVMFIDRSALAMWQCEQFTGNGMTLPLWVQICALLCRPRLPWLYARYEARDDTIFELLASWHQFRLTLRSNLQGAAILMKQDIENPKAQQHRVVEKDPPTADPCDLQPIVLQGMR